MSNTEVTKYQFPDEEPKQPAATENEEFEVEIVDDTPEKDKGRKPLEKPVEEPTDEELGAYSDKVQARIKELTHARHDERRRADALTREKQELERVAKQVMDENRQLKQYVQTGEKQFVETYKSAAEKELDMARRAYKDAYDAGDSNALVAAQEAITEAKLKLQKAQDFKPASLQEEKIEVQTQQPPQRPPQQPVVRLDEKTERWQARNQWFGAPGQEEMTSFALGLHQKLVNSGVDPRSDEYFERIDARMKSVFPEQFGEEDKPTSGSGSKKPSTVVAPAARSSGAKKIQLTATQVALAKKFGLTPQQYAAELVKLEKQNG